MFDNIGTALVQAVGFFGEINFTFREIINFLMIIS